MSDRRSMFKFIALSIVLQGVTALGEPAWTQVHDPFLQTSGYFYDSYTPKPLELQAIVYDGKHSTVVIDGQIFRVGDELPDGFRVLAIAPDFVDLKNGSSIKELHLQLRKLKSIGATITPTSDEEQNR